MLTYHLEHRGKQNKTAYLVSCIKEDILSGELKAGERLPSKRAFAAHLAVSVITVENAYLELEEEGYLTARPRSGYYVNRLNLPEKTPARKSPIQYLEEEGSAGKSGAPGARESGTDSAREDGSPENGTHTAYYPAFARIMRRLLSARPDLVSRKPPHLGCAVLRNAIADYLRRYRGMEAQPGRIIIGSGAEYLYGLIVQLLGRDRVYGIEEPSYEKIALVYEANGAVIERLPLEREGISSETLAKARADVLHITPFHSYPTGVTATAEKRYEYLAYAEKKGAWLIEDDFDSEFASPRKPIETLFSMDRGERVIYLNTFSKSIAPSMRIGYMVLPEVLMEQYRKNLGFYSCTVPVFDQYVLAEFINEGSFERHLNRIRRASASSKGR